MTGLEPAAAAAAFKVAIEIVEFGFQFCSADGNAQPLIDLAEQVKHDLYYANYCRSSLWKHLCRDKERREWVVGNITRATAAHHRFEKCLLQGAEDNGTSKVKDRLKYIWVDHEKTIELEKSLSVSHASLQTVINFLHQLSFQDGFPAADASGRGAGLAPNAGCVTKRASSQRPPLTTPRVTLAWEDSDASRGVDVTSVNNETLPADSGELLD